MERPRHGGEGALGLFDQNQHSERTSPDLIPECINGDGPTRRVGADGRPWHQHCEPRDAYATAPETSHQAARRARKGVSSPLALAILAELKTRPHGATDAELREVFPDAPQGSVAKRRLDLVRRDLVVDTGRTRPTTAGSPAIVWAAR